MMRLNDSAICLNAMVIESQIQIFVNHDLSLIQKKSTVTALPFFLWLLLLVLWRMTAPEPKAIHISGFHV